LAASPLCHYGLLRSAQGCRVDLDSDHPRHPVEIEVERKQSRSPAPGDGGDHAIDHSSGGDSLASATPINERCRIEICGRIETEQVEAQQRPTEVSFVTIVLRAGQDLHGLRHGQWPVRFDERRQSTVNNAAGGPVEFNPRRSLSQQGSRVAAGTNICGQEVDGMRPAHPEGLVQSHRLAGQVPERKFDCFRLGPDSVAAHDRLDVVVLDFSGSSSSCYAAMCTKVHGASG
jgi:hypothetical protein